MGSCANGAKAGRRGSGSLEQNRGKLLTAAMLLAVITIFYNAAEGVVSTYFGLEDETLALLGFGVDSFVEVVSGLGVAHMVFRMRRNSPERRDRFERQALRVTGTAFYLLAVGLTAGSVYNIAAGRAPETTLAGIVISSVSIITMWLLIRFKLRVGRALSSDAVVADAHCTRACLQLSAVLLVASGLYEWLAVPYIDAAGSLVIALLCLREGREAFSKARSSLDNEIAAGP